MILVHICCAVDSHYFLERLIKEYSDEPLVGFFYDPNIHPFSEYALRLLEVKRSCERLNIPLYEGEYDVAHWLEAVKGLEDEPEKGARCSVCFDNRLEVSAQKALKLGHDKVTTSLLMSPLKSQEQLTHSGKALQQKYGVEFVAVDFRSNGGTQAQAEVTKKERLYRQDYCGCLFALTKQRYSQERVADELASPINRAILPNSIDERLALFEKRLDLEEAQKKYAITQERFMNYRLLFARLEYEKSLIPVHVLNYSYTKKRTIKAKVETAIDEVYYLNRGQGAVMTLKTYNKLANTQHKSITALLYDSSTPTNDMRIRHTLFKPYSTALCLVVEHIPQKNFILTQNSVLYEDKQEVLHHL